MGSSIAKTSGESVPEKKTSWRRESELTSKVTVAMPSSLSALYSVFAASFTSALAAELNTMRLPPYEVPPPVPHRSQDLYPIIQPAPSLPTKSRISCSSLYGSISIFSLNGCPHVTTVIGWPWNGFKAFINFILPASSSCHRGPCCIIWPRSDTILADKSCAASCSSLSMRPSASARVSTSAARPLPVFVSSRKIQGHRHPKLILHLYRPTPLSGMQSSIYPIWNIHPICLPTVPIPKGAELPQRDGALSRLSIWRTIQEKLPSTFMTEWGSGIG